MTGPLIVTTLLRFGLLLLLAASACPSVSQERLAQSMWEVPTTGYVWHPMLSPDGPVVIVIGLREQRAYVYRNGVLIGVSKVSTGKAGYETPTGVFTILEKQREHYSNRYDDAPMPFIQRLTWDGVALHAGKVQAHPASHGCIRMPYAFSEALFGITARGITVIVRAEAVAPTLVYAGLVTGSAFTPPTQTMSIKPFSWVPERSPSGPITLVLSSRDREIIVLRNAVEIGRSSVTMSGDLFPGTRIYSLLQDKGPEPSIVAPGRPALRWMALSLEPSLGTSPSDLRQWVASGRLQIDPTFASLVYDVLAPGTSLIVTDEGMSPDRLAPTIILEAEQGGAERDKLPER